jgi:hypothetical protein
MNRIVLKAGKPFGTFSAKEKAGYFAATESNSEILNPQAA